jgi:hypothetical protein
MGRECDQRGPWFGREWVVAAFGGVQRDDDSGEQRARRSRDPARPLAERVCLLALPTPFQRVTLFYAHAMPPRKRQKWSRDNELEPAKTMSRRSSSSGATVTSSSRLLLDSRPTSRAASPPGSETSVSSDDDEDLHKPVILTPSMGKAYVDIPLRFHEPIPHHKPSKPTYCTPSMPRPIVEVPTLASILRKRRRREGRASALMLKPSHVEEEPCPVLWLPLPIPKNFTQISAQERISIREFIYRFHRQLFGAPKAWSKKMAADFDSLTENTIPRNMEDKNPDDILFSWVSPRNLAHLLTGLLDALAKATEYPDRDVRVC